MLKKVFSGEYEYVEAGETRGAPSFHFVVSNPSKEYEIYFYCKSGEEFKEMLKSLERQVYRPEKYKAIKKGS